MDEHLSEIKTRLNEIEKRLNILLDKNNSEHDLFKTGLLSAMSKYIDKNYNKISNGRVLVASFHDKIIEALKDEKINLEVKTISPLMTYVFGFAKIKSCGDWYYTGIEEKYKNVLPKPNIIIV